MYKYMLILIMVFLMAAPSIGKSSETDETLFVIVTTEDPMTQLMSMVLATQMTQKGKNTEILLCGEAGGLALMNSKEIFFKPQNASPQMLLKGLIKKGVKVEICPPYLPNKEKTSSDLIGGVSVANPSKVADKLLRKDIKILSY